MKALSPLILSLSAIACVTVPASHPTTAAAPLTTQLIGEGRLFAAPDYVELVVTVHAECFAQPQQASEAADAAVAKVIGVLRAATNSDNPGDGVIAKGGLTKPFERYRGGATSCRNTFQKVSTVVMKSSKVREFPSAFARIQKEILSGALKKPITGKAMTFATMGEPTGRLNYAHRERLEQRALGEALQSAKAKFAQISKGACKEGGHRIVKFVERSARGGRPISYERSQPTSGENIEMDAIWINKLLEVHFALAKDACGS